MISFLQQASNRLKSVLREGGTSYQDILLPPDHYSDCSLAACQERNQKTDFSGLEFLLRQGFLPPRPPSSSLSAALQKLNHRFKAEQPLTLCRHLDYGSYIILVILIFTWWPFLSPEVVSGWNASSIPTSLSKKIISPLAR